MKKILSKLIAPAIIVALFTNYFYKTEELTTTVEILSVIMVVLSIFMFLGLGLFGIVGYIFSVKAKSDAEKSGDELKFNSFWKFDEKNGMMDALEKMQLALKKSGPWRFIFVTIPLLVGTVLNGLVVWPAFLILNAILVSLIKKAFGPETYENVKKIREKMERAL